MGIGGMAVKQIGKVWLVGAGPGDIGLFTLKGKAVLKQAEVVIYDALVGLELLGLIPNGAETIYVGKRAHNHAMSQEAINQLLLIKAQEGKKVVRLKGGDPFVFGRGGEELELLAQHHIPYEVVPGITSSVAVPAYAGIPVTHRAYSSSFHVLTAHGKAGSCLKIDFEQLVRLNTTLIFLMGGSALEVICKGLIEAGMQLDMPAAIVQQGTLAHQKKVVATVSTLWEAAKKAQIGTPAIIVVGKVCELSKAFEWVSKRPLVGKQIVLTRPKQLISQMAARLRELGASVIEMPTIYTTRLMSHEFETSLNHLANCQLAWLVFTSGQGVMHFFDNLKELKWDMRKLLSKAQLKIAVIGSGTRKALEAYGLFADVMPEIYCAKALGELLAKEVRQDEEVFIFRAEKGSQALNEALDDVKICYHDVPIYKTLYHISKVLQAQVIEAFEKGEIDYVTFTSASTVQGFVATMGDLAFSKVHAICIGEQTAQMARGYGMQVEIAEEATIESMIACIQALSTYDDYNR